MFKIRKKPKSPNIVWDASKNCPLCKFEKGIYETEDTSIAEKLKSMGYQVEGEVQTEDKEKVEREAQAEDKEKKEKRK